MKVECARGKRDLCGREPAFLLWYSACAILQSSARPVLDLARVKGSERGLTLYKRPFFLSARLRNRALCVPFSLKKLFSGARRDS